MPHIRDDICTYFAVNPHNHKGDVLKHFRSIGNQKTAALNSCTATNISASSVNPSAIQLRQATTGETPSVINLAACTSKRVLAGYVGCQTNFNMPVVYYSTLMSVAYGKSGKEAGLDGQMIKARQLEAISGK